MSILKVVIVSDEFPALEVTAFSGNLHKVYLVARTNLIVNGDGDDTTDWINPTYGLAQYWQLLDNT